jgi:plasmid stabilization system protein ParE
MVDKPARTVVWSPIAEEQAARFIQRIRQENRGTAWRWTQRLLALVGGLARHALRGHGVRELNRRVRVGEILVEPCRVIYRVDDDQIVILTIRLAREPLHDHQRNRDHHSK